MNPRIIKTIWSKELTEVLRDRRALIFMLLMPTIIVPLLMAGIGRFAVAQVRQQEARVVLIASSAEDQAVYTAMAHEVFLESRMGALLQKLRNPMLQMLLPAASRDKLGQTLPAEVFTDPGAWAQWINGVASEISKQLEGMDSPENASRQQAELDALKAEGLDKRGFEESAVEFYRVLIRPVGFVAFQTLPEATAGEGVEPDETLPEVLRKHPRGRMIHELIAQRLVDAVLETETSEDGQVRIQLFHDSTLPLSGEAARRVETLAQEAGRVRAVKNIKALKQPEAVLRPVVYTSDTNLAPRSRILAAALAGLVPYLVIFFAYTGAVFPAQDLGVGEKERQTLETLLLSPADRSDIAIGKFLLVLTTSLASAVLGAISVGVAMLYFLPPSLRQTLDFQLGPATLIPLLLLALPSSGLFAGLLLGLSIYARSMREAQNYLGPVALLLILPSVSSLIPGLELTWKTALIPLVNVSLLARDFLKGDPNWAAFAFAVASSFALAAIALAFCTRQFNREEVLFRT